MDPTRPSQLSVNVRLLDDQHTVLIAHIERLEQAMTAAQSADAIPKIIRDLEDYAGYHLPTEERLMVSYGYLLRDVHTIEHQKFLTRLREIERMVAEGHVTAAVQLLGRLRGWLDRHVMEWDAKLGDFLNTCGVA